MRGWRRCCLCPPGRPGGLRWQGAAAFASAAPAWRRGGGARCHPSGLQGLGRPLDLDPGDAWPLGLA
eukprot:7941954-Pyramimonas_sp.AAC.1